MDGVLIIDKPMGITSHDVVARVRRILRERRVGHTGTLDPFATGVLVILVGRATRLAQFLSGADKEYDALVRLGFATDTGDLTGKPLPTDAVWSPATLTLIAIETALADLRGTIAQVPPMYSAKKQGGKKLYELARRGEEVERTARTVMIHTLELAESSSSSSPTRNEAGTADIPLHVCCSAGTYVRALATDLGKRLGSGAHLAGLRRTKAGSFSVSKALSLEELDQKVQNNVLDEVLITPDAALSNLPFVTLDEIEAKKTQQGMPLEVSSPFADGAHVRMRDQSGQLLAIGAYDQQAKLLRPRVVLALE